MNKGLLVPRGVAGVANCRVIAQYNIAADSMFLRFDVMAGGTQKRLTLMATNDDENKFLRQLAGQLASLHGEVVAAEKELRT